VIDRKIGNRGIVELFNQVNEKENLGNMYKQVESGGNGTTMHKIKK
jgi:hypothetical protein